MSRTLKTFKYNGERFSNISDFSTLIELLFEELRYEPNHDFNSYKDYYLCYNPFEDGAIKSATIYHEDGNMLVYNNAIEVIRNGQKIKVRSITITEYHRLLGYMDNYVDFVLLTFNINPLVYNQYKKELPNYLMKTSSFQMDWKLRKGIEQFRRFLFNFYITDKDIMNSGKRELRNIIKRKFKKPRIKEEKPKPKIVKPGMFDAKLVQKYIRDRKIFETKNAYPICMEFNGGSYRTPALCMEYPSGFKKIRFINKTSKLRYLANSEDGTYDDLFEVRINKTKELYIVEGEIEGMTIAQYIDDDIMALHNTNALPTNKLTQLEGYDKVHIRIDGDTYEKVESMIEARIREDYPSINLEIKPKFLSQEKSIDYNEYHLRGWLTREAVIKPILVL